MTHKVLVHNRSYDETYFVTKFVGEFKSKIKMAIKLHRPRIVDVALSLAKTQEELIQEATNAKPQFKGSYRENYKTATKPGVQTKGILGPHPEEPKKVEEKPKWEDRYESLKSARRARGECFKCGEKWGLGHKCPKSVQLHVLEELLEVLMLQEDEKDDNQDEETSEEELVLLECAASGTMGKKNNQTAGVDSESGGADIGGFWQLQ